MIVETIRNSEDYSAWKYPHIRLWSPSERDPPDPASYTHEICRQEALRRIPATSVFTYERVIARIRDKFLRCRYAHHTRYILLSGQAGRCRVDDDGSTHRSDTACRRQYAVNRRKNNTVWSRTREYCKAHLRI